VSCTKKQDGQANPGSVKMTIMFPLEGHTYHNGDTVKIAAAVTYDGVLHGYEVSVTDTATGTILFDYAEHVHQDSFLIEQYFILTGTEARAMKLNLRTEIDHNGVEATKQVLCQYVP
jgi:hypothetical protein